MTSHPLIVPAPVRRSVTVRSPQARAFEVFTTRIGAWWPPTHHISTTPFRDIVLEPRAGGRWYEVGSDGSECDWGHVLAWEPPSRLMLAWQIDAQFHFDPGLVTEVEVRFIAEGADATRIELEHRNLERFGDRAEAMRERVGGDNGWMRVLASYVDNCDRPTA
jgi:uncharacterized protein YndB with AHSA1/START domain